MLAKRRRSSLRGAATSPGAPRDAAVSLLALPPELLAIVLERLGSLREVARLRAVCRHFDASCQGVLRAAFLQLERSVWKQAQLLGVETAARVDSKCAQQAGSCARYRGQKALQRQSSCLHQLQLLRALLGLLRACTWRYVTAGVQPLACGDLLDMYRRLLARLTAVDRANNRRPATPPVIGHLHTTTLRALAGFQRKVERQLLRAKGEVCTMLPGITFLDILESCLNCERTAPHTTRSGNKVRLHTTYSMDGCWLSIRWNGSVPHRLSGSDILHLGAVMRNLVWMVNNEHLHSARQNVDMKINGAAGPSYPSRQAFNIIEECNRVYLYGNNAHAFGSESLPQLLVHVDVVCNADLLPKTLLQATPAPSDARASPLPPRNFQLSVVLESIDLLSSSYMSPETYVYTN